jgi:hypothetical protein
LAHTALAFAEVEMTRTKLYALNMAGDGFPCPLWEIPVGSVTHLRDRVMRWNAISVGDAQSATRALVTEGLAVVYAENADLSCDGWTTDDAAGLRAVADSSNWLFPSEAPERPTINSLHATPSGIAALEALEPLEPDEIQLVTPRRRWLP